MVESSPLGAPASPTPRGAEAAASAAAAGDVTGPTAVSRRRDKVGGGLKLLSRAKAARQKERLRILSTPQVRHHDVIKDLTKVRAASTLFFGAFMRR